MMKYRILVLFCLFQLASCDVAEFRGTQGVPGGGEEDPKIKDVEPEPGTHSGTGIATGSADGGGTGVDEGEPPTGLTEADGTAKVELDFTACSQQPNKGLEPSGRCPEGSFFVAMNDGNLTSTNGYEVTCCPFKGDGILSKDDKNLNIERNVQCEAGEVAVAITKNEKPLTLLCSKVNTHFLTTSTPVTAEYVNLEGGKKRDPLAAALNFLKDTYNYDDFCRCPDGTVWTGNHAGNEFKGDNKCTDTCVSIIRK